MKDFDSKDLKEWRDALEDLSALESRRARLCDAMALCVSDYEKKIASVDEELSKNKALLEQKAFENEEFITKSGGLKMDYFPHIAAIKASKPRVHLRPNEEYWMEQGYIREKKEFDKKRWNEDYKVSSFVNEESNVINSETGEIIPHCSAETRQSVNFIFGRELDED